MTTRLFQIDDIQYTKVSNAACLVELSQNCKNVFVHTSQTSPTVDEPAFHVLNGIAARTFVYGGGHGVFVRMANGAGSVVVTGDSLL